jgi:acetoin utilization deacetylase AcuC-like enzyme
VKVGLLTDALFRAHDAGPGHPEHARRLDAVLRGVEEARLDRALVAVPPRPATREELLRVHTAAHVDLVARTAGRSVRLDPDTATSPRSHEAALLAAGAVVEAVDRVLDARLDRAFCVVRPPGHHATRSRAMGFCLYNNVAAGAAAALARGLERVAVLDFDVHHGNGTQDVFEEDPRVLFISSHQFPFYPGTGDLDEVGEGPGRGFTVNLPMPAGCGDEEYARVYREVVGPIARSFDPQLVLVSAGFDAAAGDPLAAMQLSPAGFRAIADACVSAAAGAARGRVVAVLEGGYSEAGLATGAAALVSSLVEAAVREPGPASPAGGSRAEAVAGSFRRAHARHWPVLAR